MKENVILSFTSNYSYYELQPFIESWKETQKNSLYVMYLDLSPWTIDCLKHDGVNLIRVDDDVRTIKDCALLRIACVIRFLEGNYKRLSQVLFVDLRDLIFQRDFVFENEGMKYLGLNCESINNDFSIVADFNTRLLGNEEWKSKFGNKPLINGGAFWGTAKELYAYFVAVFDFCKDKEAFFGNDQSAMNYLIYEGLLEFDNIIFSYAQSGNVVSIIRNLSDYTNDGENIIRCKDQSIPTVVHQYDRSAELTAFVDKRYRKETPDISNEYLDVRSNLEIVKFLIKKGEACSAFDRLSKLNHNGETVKDVWFSIIDDMLDAVSKDGMLMSNFIKNLLMNYRIDFFSQLTIEDKINQVHSLIDCYKKHDDINECVVRKFSDEVYDFINHFVDENKWGIAYECITEVEHLNIKRDEKFYLLTAKVYKNVFRTSEARKKYDMACISTLRNKLYNLNYYLYIDMLNELKNDLIIIITSKDAAVYGEKKLWLEIFGIEANLNSMYRYSWLCIIDGGKVVREQSSVSETISTEYEVNKNLIRVTSSGYNVKHDLFCKPVSIKLNGKELCMNQRGLNFVVLEKNTCHILDSVVFDTFFDDKVCRRKLGHDVF